MRSLSLFVLITSMTLVDLASSFMFKFYGNKGCRDELPGQIEKYWENLGCQTSHNAGGAKGVIVTSGDGDNRLGVRFYESDKCDPTGKLVGSPSYGDGCADTGDSGWGSFSVECLCEDCSEECLK